MEKQVSTLIGVVTIIAVALIGLGGVFLYERSLTQKYNDNQKIQLNNTAAKSTSCLDTAVTQYDINICAGSLEKKADDALNVLYQKIIVQLDAASLNQLIIAEKAWIKYRDENCKVPNVFPEAGTGAVADNALCREQLTNDRIKQLNSLYYGYITGIQGVYKNNNQGEALPTKVGQCIKTTVAKIRTRLVDATTGENIIGSGSAIEYVNGGVQVSYETIPGIENSHIGDEVNLCLLSIPANCPPGDYRGKYYGATNLKTGEAWSAPDAQHMCGGA